MHIGETVGFFQFQFRRRARCSRPGWGWIWPMGHLVPHVSHSLSVLVSSSTLSRAPVRITGLALHDKMMVAGPTSSADSVWVREAVLGTPRPPTVAVEVRCTDLEVEDSELVDHESPRPRNRPRLSANSSQDASVTQRCGDSTLPLFSPLSSSLPLAHPLAHPLPLLFSILPLSRPPHMLPLPPLLCPPSLRFSPPPFPAPLLCSALPPPPPRTADTRRACDTVTSLLVC